LNTLLLICVLVVIAAILQAMAGGSNRRVLFQRKSLMTKHELAFWRLLVAAAKPLNVAPQVAMGALVKTNRGLDKKQWRVARNSFDRKIVDFVLFDDDGEVRLLVELDDSTHNDAKDAARDRITAAARYPTLRVRARDARSVAALSALLAPYFEPADAAQDPRLGTISPAAAPPAAQNRSAPPSSRRA
jgi:hypothetical protein